MMFRQFLPGVTHADQARMDGEQRVAMADADFRGILI
jgi:hypothetical protein